MARCPACRHDTGDPAIDVYQCPTCRKVWCDACGPSCAHAGPDHAWPFVLSDDAYL